MAVGSERTRLVVLRGNSGSGKSTVAKALRDSCGRGIAWVSQDLIRRTSLQQTIDRILTETGLRRAEPARERQR